MADKLLDDLYASSEANANKQGNKEKKKSKNFFKNPLIKELKPILYFSSAIATLIIASSYTIFDPSGTMYYKNIGDGAKEVNNNLDFVESSIVSIADKTKETESLNEGITVRKKELDSANLVRIPLDDSFYFTSYFDTLVKKHQVKLKRMALTPPAENEEGGEGDSLFKEDEAVAQTPATDVPEFGTPGFNEEGTDKPVVDKDSDEGIKPIYIEMQGNADSITALFKDMYTKRITYDENIEFTNLYDGQVNVKFVVKFREEVANNDTVQDS